MARLDVFSKSLLLAVALCALSGFTWRTVHAAEAPAGKLVIVKALYGDLPDGANVDVTDKVSAMVKDDSLSVLASNDYFGDPAEGKPKKLRVDYTVDGVAFTKTVNEWETLVISKPPK